jgi:hypothetical protein
MIGTSDAQEFAMEIKDSATPRDAAIEAYWLLTVIEDRAESAGAPLPAADEEDVR